MIMRDRALILLALLIISPVLTRGQILHGRITDDQGLPLPAASVYISELKQGTTTNNNGLYEITLAPGSYTVSYRFLGFATVTRNITIAEKSITADITMTEQLYDIPAVRVSASGRDPAFYIMRKAVGMAPYHLSQVKSYRAGVYIKGGGSIDRIPRYLKRRLKAEANGNQLEEGHYYFTETLNEITFTAPDRYVNRLISASSSERPDNGEVSPMDYIEASFYQPVLAGMAVSPLAPNAFSHYRFTFLGSSLHDDYVIDKIRVTPRTRSQQLFSGTIYIVEDLWAIHSLDLVNDNLAGRIRIRQQYAPVQAGIWMPVSHEFTIDLSIMGIKARAAYTSAVTYYEVEPDLSLPLPPAYAAAAVEEKEEHPERRDRRTIEAILEKDEITAREMAQLARLNEKSVREARGKAPLEIEDKTTYITDDEASARDTSWWAAMRPIPLTPEERASLSVIRDSLPALAGTNRNEVTITIGKAARGNNQDRRTDGGSSAARIIREVATGKRWQLSESTSLHFKGLIDMRSLSYNTVDGFVAGTGLTLSARMAGSRRINIAPSARYAFSRQSLMWNLSAAFLYDPLHGRNILLRAGSHSDEFPATGINPLVNTLSTLLFRENMMKLYSSRYLIAGHTTDLANGLTLTISGMYELRDPLDNNATFSFFRRDKPWSPNLPDNPYVSGTIAGYEPEISFSHRHLSVSSSLVWTPRRHYRISSGAKIYASSDWPTFTLNWKHGYNYNDTLSGGYDLIYGEINRTGRFGPMNELRWRIRAGGFINSGNVRLRDMYYFNTQSSPVLLDNYEDAFYLKPSGSVAARRSFAEGHISYGSYTILLKRITPLSRTLIRENLGVSLLWSPESGIYGEAGYWLSELFLAGTTGVWAGFSERGFESAGVRVILRFN